jgi:hypothetical protein
MRTTLALLVVFGMVLACSGGSSSSSSSSGAGTSISDMCGAYCDWSVRCAKSSQDCRTECDGDLNRYHSKLSNAYTSMFVSCFQSLACSEDDEACVANFAAADPAYPNIPEVTACNEKRTECSQPTPEGDGGSVTQPSTAFSDDYCLSIAALTPEARATANECLSRPCAGIRDCLIQAGSFNY